MKTRLLGSAAAGLIFLFLTAGLAQEIQIREIQVQGNGVIQVEGGGVIQIQGGNGKAQIQVQVQAVAAGEDAADEAEEAEIPDEIEKKLTQFFEKWIGRVKEPRKIAERNRLKALIAEIQEKTGLEAEDSGPLTDAIDKAIDASWKAFEEAQKEMMVQSWGMMMASELGEGDVDAQLKEAEQHMMSMTPEQVTEMLRSQGGTEGGRPEREEIWKEALEKALNAEQLKIWNAQLAEEQDAKNERIKVAMESWFEKQAKPLRAQLESMLEKLAEVVPLDDQRREQVEKLIDEAIKSALTGPEEQVRKMIEQMPPDQVRMVERGNMSFGVSGAKDPVETKIWKEGLAKILTEGESETWAKEWKTFNEEEGKELADMAAKIIDARAANMRQQYERQFGPVVADILATVKLDEDRETELRELAEKALDDFEEFWKKKNLDYLEGLPRSEQRTMVQRGYINIGLSENEMPLQAKTWSEGLKKVLTEEEHDRWVNANEARDKRQQESFGRLLLARMDRAVGLTADQREELLPLLSEIGQDRSHRQRGQMVNYNTSTIDQVFLNPGDQKKIAAKLDESQQKRWKKWLEHKQNANRVTSFERPESRAEPESLDEFREEAITIFLYELRKRERREFLVPKLGEVGEIARVAGLSAEQEAELTAAAKGMAEIKLVEVAAGRSQWIRQSIKDVPRENVYQRLNDLSGNRFGISQDNSAAEQLWKDAVDRVLTSAQEKTWRAAVKDREEFEQSVIVFSLVAQVENVLSLTAEQAENFIPVFDSLITEYREDLDMRFRGHRDPWYYNGYYSLSLVEGIPDETLKRILTEDQLKIWNADHKPRMESYWNGIERNRKNRLEREKRNK